MDIKLYNEWKKSFIDDLTSRLINIDKNKKVYDITDSDKLLIVHNSHFPVSSLGKMSVYLTSAFEKKIKSYKSSNKSYISLSIQDKYHNDFYISIGERIKTVKFVYDKLNHENVGIIYPEDAFSSDLLECILPMHMPIIFIDKVDNFYTVDSFLNNTVFYNEITYKRDDYNYLPSAILCEDEISEYEMKYADILGVPILYRKKYILDFPEDYVEREKNQIKMYSNPYRR